MLATKGKRVKLDCKVSKEKKGRKENLARMGLLVRKENLEKRGQLGLQEWLQYKDQKEIRGIEGSAPHMERKDTKVNQVNLELLESQERWEFQDRMASMAPQAL